MIKHRKQDGCEVIFLKKEAYVGNGIVDIYICSTHNKEVCHCGVEWGRHEEYYNTINEEEGHETNSNITI